MPYITAEELLKLKPVAGTHALAGASSGPAGFWSPDSITRIIKEIRELMLLYQKMKGAAGGNNDVVMDSGPVAVGSGPQQQQGPQGITMPQVIAVAKQFLDNLANQGHGDDTLLQVLEKTPFTIKQIRGFLG